MFRTWILLIMELNLSLVCLLLVKCIHSSSLQSNNCSRAQTECGDTFCCCDYRHGHGSMTCSHVEPELKYIPRPPVYVANIYFTGNNQPQISEHSLSNLTTNCIRRLWLDNNGVVNITPGAFGGLRCLKSLDLGHNIGLNHGQLRRALASANKLNSLRLTDIGLTSVSENLFELLNKSRIDSIDLSGNNLQNSSSLNVSVFARFPRTLSLFFRTCNTENVIVTSKVSVKKLDLRDNRIGPHSPIFCKEGDSMLPRILEIHLESNQIEFISNNSMSCLRTLATLFLSDNRIAVLKGNSFTHLSNLQRLVLNNMKVRPIIKPFAFNNSRLEILTMNMNDIVFSNESVLNIFGGLPNLRNLDISRNNFFTVEDQSIVQMLSPLVRLEQLRMEGTRLRRIPDCFRVLKHISYLSVSGNSIQTLKNSLVHAERLNRLILLGNAINVIEQADLPENLLNTLKEVDLSENPFSCTCKLLWFRTWIDKTLRSNKTRLLSWPKTYYCKTPRRMHFIDFHPTKESCAYHDPLIPVYISSGCIFILLVIFIPLVYKKRWHLSYWYYKLRRGKTLDAERRALLDNVGNIVYDAYVIYQDEDRSFVHNDLREMLEQKHGLKLHIWHRDAENGVKLEIMFDAIYASRLAIAVFSDNFLQDDDCRFQFYVALDRAKEMQIDKVIVVLLDNLERQNLTKYWCVILSKMPTVEWSDDVGDIRRIVFEEKLIPLLNNY